MFVDMLPSECLGATKLLVSCVLLGWVTVSGSGVKILGLDSASRMPRDFIVVLKSNSNETHRHIQLQTVTRFTEGISVENDDPLVSNQYSFGKFSALRVHLSDADVTKLAVHDDVEFVQANQRLRMSASGACAAQSTGSELWGLSRMSTHAKPSYGNAKYKYLIGEYTPWCTLHMSASQRNSV